ncbi:MAG: gamma-glutamyltransferase [Actinomycetota bacterium]|nr:gamma-glutamyltransferase [Actinomycetota bacterium]
MTKIGRRGSCWGVASPHPAATDAAAAVLGEGGSAVDAAIAAAGVLTVVYPHNCSIGGDLIALVRSPGERPKAVFGVGRSAAAIDVDALRRDFGERLPDHGPHSISVPGVVSGWQALHELGGWRPIGRLLEPAIALASQGAVVSASLARALEELETSDPGITSVFGPPGTRLGLGDVFIQPALAETLARVADEPDAYYRGELAQRLAAGLEAAGSPITLEDLSAHQPFVADAAMTEAGTLAPRLFTAGLPSQGRFFAALAETVDGLLARGYDLTGRDARALARAFAWISQLRDELLSDPARAPATRGIDLRLGEEGHLAAWLSTARADRLAPDRLAPDHFARDHIPPDERRGGQRLAEGPARPRGDTVAVVTFDAAGRSVSMLQSVFHSFGSRVLDPATGVLFHSRQSMFTLRPAAPGALGPRLMPPHTLCPTMVDTSEGTPLLLLATMGGRAQPQILTQVLLQVAKGASAADALGAPRFIVEGTGTSGSQPVVRAESDLPDAAVGSLAQGGFDVRLVSARNEEMGHAQLLWVDQDRVVGAADPRSDGTARTGTAPPSRAT